MPKSILKTKFPVKIRDIHKIEKNISICISVFGYENKEKHLIYVSKKCYEDNHVDLLLIGEEGKRHYVLSKILICSHMMIHYILEQNIFAIQILTCTYSLRKVIIETTKPTINIQNLVTQNKNQNILHN